MNFISELREGENVSEVYLCKTKTQATTKAGKNYYSVILQDKTGVIDGKVWELNNGIEHFETMDFIRIEAQVTSFNNALQLNIKRRRRADEGEYNQEDYFPASKKDVKSMYEELLAVVDTVKEEHLNKILKMFFVEDEKFIKEFKNHSAAKSIHHGFIGGLLEHSLSVAKLCTYIADNYPIIKKDLLVTAALLHDIGKVNELSSFPENDYTDEGQFIGHIVMGTMMVDKKIKSIEGFPVVLGNELKHCILAHHGELEFGSPKKPALIEALALAHADNLDAKLETFKELIDSNNGKKDWLGYSKMFDANVRLTEDM